jgi:hypothetical protein
MVMQAAQIRHGDVFLNRIGDSILGGTLVKTQNDRVVLAGGEPGRNTHEVTGNVALLEREDGGRVLVAEEPALLDHAQHGAVTLEPGYYEVIRQREYVPQSAPAMVAD